MADEQVGVGPQLTAGEALEATVLEKAENGLDEKEAEQDESDDGVIVRGGVAKLLGVSDPYYGCKRTLGEG